MAACLMAPFMSLAGCTAMQTVSCVGSTLASTVCSFMCSTISRGAADKAEVVSRTARLSYLGLFLITTIVAGVFRDIAPEQFDRMDFISKNMECPPDHASPTCMARAFVLRMCFGHAMFHLCLALATVGADDLSNPRSAIHTSAWGVKIVLWLLLHIIPLFMPSIFFLNFGWFALFCGICFLVVQIVLYIEWIYDWNESWVEKDGVNNVTGPWHISILAISFFAFTTAITLTVFMFIWFGHKTDTAPSEHGCGLYTFFTSFNLVMWLGLTGLSFKATEWMPSTGLMPSAMVSAFMTFKVLMALYSQNNCNVLSQAGQVYKGPPQVMGAISIIIAIILAAYNSVWISGSLQATAKREQALSVPQQTEPAPTPAPAPAPSSEHERQYPLLKDVKLETVNSQSDEEAQHEEEEKLSGPIGYNICAFHMSFLLGMCYVAMQITNWNEDFEKNHVDNSTASMWIKVVDSWMLALAYGWSMMAPKILTNRNFPAA